MKHAGYFWNQMRQSDTLLFRMELFARENHLAECLIKNTCLGKHFLCTWSQVARW